MQAQPLIAVQDVPASSRWYQGVLGAESGHGGEEYERVVVDGRIVLQLHAWGAHDHPGLDAPGSDPAGHGVLLWFQTAGFDAAMARVREVGAAILDGPKVNPRANHRELWLRDPDGYIVVLAGAEGDVGG